MLCSVPAGAQHYFGVKGGYGMSYGRFQPSGINVASLEIPIDQLMTWGLYSGGIMWKYYTPERFAGGIAAELEFMEKAYSYRMLTTIDPHTVYRRRYKTVFLPVMWQPHINAANNRLRIFANLGVGVGYNFPTSDVFRLIDGEGVIYKEKYHNKLVRDNPFHYGLTGGVGFNLVFGRFEFMAEGRYYLAYGDILRDKSIYPGENVANKNLFTSSPVDNVTISVGLYYRLSPEPHAPAPGRKALQRQAEKEAQKMQKEADKARKKLERKSKKQGKAIDPQETASQEETGEPAETDNVLEVQSVRKDEIINEPQNGNDQTTESSPADTEGRQ